MMDERRANCDTKNPICTTIGFMFGMILGSLLQVNGSLLHIVLSILVATLVFHWSYVRNFNIKQVISTVIKKGS
jgi:hypothetical protein